MRSRLKIIAGPRIQWIPLCPSLLRPQMVTQSSVSVEKGRLLWEKEKQGWRDTEAKSSVPYTNLFALGCTRFHLFRPQGMDTKARKSRSRPFQSELLPGSLEVLVKSKFIEGELYSEVYSYLLVCCIWAHVAYLEVSIMFRWTSKYIKITVFTLFV